MSEDGITILVCGGRDYSDVEGVFNFLDAIAGEHEVSGLIAGDATGADQIALEWANQRSIDNSCFRAKWKTEGKAAGPLRNQRMLDEGAPDLVIAFPGGRGTADMVRRAVEAGIPVVETGPRRIPSKQGAAQ